MKTRIYLRIGKTKRGAIVKASTKPSSEAVYTGSYNKKYLPTVLVAVDLIVPDKEFDSARILLQAEITKTTPACSIKQVEGHDETKD